MKAVLALTVLLALALHVSADVYMHSPRGSNNRCDEQNNDRQTTNRLFNSQNNAAGGVPVAPSVKYFGGSVLQLEWTNQHSCGPLGHTQCDVIWQYSCSEDYKDGTSQDPTGDNGGNTCTNEVTTANFADDNVGYHEPVTYFTDCNARERNKGLFTAEENVNDGAGAQATRQNPGGGTAALECQEERDYYPYWHPTPFRDLVILTTNQTRCDWYQSQSENVLGKNRCDNAAHNNEAACTGAGAAWVQDPAHGIPAPRCEESRWSRDNHLGSGQDGYMNNLNLTIPDIDEPACFLRMRYNITSGDYDAWNIDAGKNGDLSPVQDDPFVQYGEMPLRLNIDTNQFGRTFEDRSYVFQIARAPLRAVTSTIYNLAVRGRRGNIAQVRNSMEYDFTPQRLKLSVGDYVHFQWTGSNHNPAGNAGNGRNRWDRSNIVQMINNDASANYPEPLESQRLFDRKDTAYLAAFIGQAPAGGCLDEAAAAADDQSTQNCAQLNGNPTGFFDLGLIRMNTSGMYNYMCTRNNDFTNRSHKGTLVVTAFGRRAFLILLLIGGLAGVGAAAGGIYFVSRRSGAGFASFNRSSFGSRGSMRSGGAKSAGSGRAAGSHGSHRSKGSSFGGSMI